MIIAEADEFRALAEAAPDAIITADSRDRIIYANPSALRSFGYTREELLSLPLSIIMPERYRERHRAGIARFLATGEARVLGSTVELVGLRKSGEEFPLELSLSVWRKEGEVFFTAILRDISRRKQVERAARESSELLASAFDHAATGMEMLSPDGRMLRINAALCEMLGYSHEELLGTTWQSLTYPPDLAYEADFRRQLLSEPEGRGQIEKRYLHRDGHIVWALLSTSLVRDELGQPLYFIGQIQDLTEQKRLQWELERETAAVRLLQSISTASNEASSIEEALQFCLDRVCEYTGWPVGHACARAPGDNQEEFVSTKLWHLDDPDRFASLRTVSEQMRFAPGVGLIGRILLIRSPTWISDIARETNFPRARLVADLGVKAAFAVPVFVGTEIVAVLEFFSDSTAEPDGHILDVMGHVGTQLGRVVERTRAEAGLRSFAAELERRVQERTAALEASEQRFRFLVQKVQEYAIFGTDPEGRIVSWNEGAQRLLGYTPDEIIGRPARILFTEEDIRAGAPEQELATAIARGSADDERWHERKDGSRFWSSGATNALRDSAGVLRGFTKVMRDETERKRAEEEMARAQAELAIARDEAVRASQAKSVFLANMSHELRTPLNAIIGYADMVREELAEAGMQTLVDDLEKIKTAGGHLVTLVSDILDLSRIEAGRIELIPETFPIGDIIRDCVDLITPLATTRRNDLKVLCDPGTVTITADRTRVRQILYNLLSNAAKFTENGTVTVECAVNESEDGQSWVVFRVRDTGIGIAPEHMGRLFQKFEQLDPSPTRRYEGTGLGLALTRHLVEVLGGAIGVESEPGNGSLFTVRLPSGQ